MSELALVIVIVMAMAKVMVLVLHCDDAYSLSIRIQTPLNHIQFVNFIAPYSPNGGIGLVTAKITLTNKNTK